VVTSLRLEAGVRFFSEFRAYTIRPLRRLRTSTAQVAGA
jgi:hypothetical protein